jgi:hypothetical protein
MPASGDTFACVVPQEDPVAKALHRVADALFRQAKASERAVALQEEMVATAKQQAVTSAALERVLTEARSQ